MCRQGPNRICRGIEAVLENSGISALPGRAGPDQRAVRIRWKDRGCVHDTDSGENTRSAQIVNQQIVGGYRAGVQRAGHFGKSRRERSQRLRCKGLVHGAVGFFPDEAENFRNAQVGLYDLRVAERDHLAAGIQTLRESGYL